MKKIKEFFQNPIVKIVSKIISGVILFILILIAAFLIYYVISAKIYESKGEKFEPKFSLYTIISPSMVPNINVYDVVFDMKVNANEIKQGDVITFISTSSLSEGATITHRVVDIIETDSGRKFRTKGDNNLVADTSLVDESHLIGKVLFKIPALGRVQFLLQSKGGLLFALLIPAVGVVIYDILKVIRLSNIKNKVEKVIEEPKKDEELVKKEQELKKRLKKKFVNVKNVEPVMHAVTDKDIKEIKEEEEKQKTKDKYGVDMKKVFENIEELKDEDKYEMVKKK